MRLSLLEVLVMCCLPRWYPALMLCIGSQVSEDIVPTSGGSQLRISANVLWTHPSYLSRLSLLLALTMSFTPLMRCPARIIHVYKAMKML